jgi:hypothetical protein
VGCRICASDPKTIISSNDQERDMWAVRDALYHRYNGNAFQRVIYTESHDEVANGRQRTPEEIWTGNADSWFSRKRSTLGAALVFTAPGIPLIFQGQEFLEDGYFLDTVPLDWARQERFAGISLLYRDLIRLRRNWHDQTRGLRGQHIHVHHTNNTDKLIAFHRWELGGPGDDVIVVANFANRSYDSYALGFPRSGFWRVRFNSDWQGYSNDFNNHLGYDTVAGYGPRDEMPFHANVGIGPYSVLILSQDSAYQPYQATCNFVNGPPRRRRGLLLSSLTSITLPRCLLWSGDDDHGHAGNRKSLSFSNPLPNRHSMHVGVSITWAAAPRTWAGPISRRCQRGSCRQTG